MAKEQKLTIPPELERIARLRDKFVKAGADSSDIEKLDQWDRKVKKSIILLSLRGNDGVAMILDRIAQELGEIDEVLRNAKPPALTPEGAIAYTMEQAALFARRELWEWFWSLFTEAKRDIKEIKADLDAEEELDIPGL